MINRKNKRKLAELSKACCEAATYSEHQNSWEEHKKFYKEVYNEDYPKINTKKENNDK